MKCNEQQKKKQLLFKQPYVPPRQRIRYICYVIYNYWDAGTRSADSQQAPYDLWIAVL